jgi:hypothetical protein
MADEVHPERHPPSADGAEKSAGLVLDARERDAHRQSERRVVRAAVLSVLALYKPDAAQSEERSCAVLEAAEQPDAPEQLAKRRPKQQEAEQPKESVLRAASSDVRVAPLLAPQSRVAMMPPEY